MGAEGGGTYEVDLRVPGPGNYPRIILISQATEGAAGDVGRRVRYGGGVVGVESEAGLEDEPQNWRIRALTAQFYQVASTRNPEYLAVAREHIDEATELAPRTREIIRISEQQEELESRQ